MNYFNWLDQERTLSSVALTIRAQTISPNDIGRLRWEFVMPRDNIPSVDIAEITQFDFRPVAERREWNAPARPMGLIQPKLRDISLVPIEIVHKIEELELQRIAERALGNMEIFRQIVAAPIPERVDMMAASVYRRIEIDVFQAWAQGTVTVRNGLDNSAYTVSYGFASTRYLTAATGWDQNGQNAYNNLMNFIRAGIDLVGPISGVMLRQSLLNVIVASAPPTGFLATVAPTPYETEQRIQNTIPFAGGFRFVVNEDTTQPYTANAFATTRTKVWPAGKLALIPAQQPVGRVGFAPVLRAFEQATINQGAGIDINGLTAYREAKNQGRELELGVQCNAIPIPNEQVIYVIDTLVP